MRNAARHGVTSLGAEWQRVDPREWRDEESGVVSSSISSRVLMFGDLFELNEWGDEESGVVSSSISTRVLMFDR